MNPPSSAGLVMRFAFLALAWGCSFLFIKVALEGLSPSQVMLGRVLVGAITLGLVVWAGRIALPRGRWVWGHLLVIGLFLCVIPFTLFAAAETVISSGLASIYNATTPLLTALDPDRGGMGCNQRRISHVSHPCGRRDRRRAGAG